LAELLDTINTKEMADSAYEYLTSYILLIDQNNPGLLKKTLTEYTVMMKPNLVNSTLNILLLSGKLWLQSNAANMDVCMVPVHHRNGIDLTVDLRIYCSVTSHEGLITGPAHQRRLRCSF
jgi:hypothetical protein